MEEVESQGLSDRRFCRRSVPDQNGFSEQYLGNFFETGLLPLEKIRILKRVGKILLYLPMIS